MTRRIFVFPAIAAISAAVALTVAVLIVASFFLAGDTAPSGFLRLHLIIAAVFVALALVPGGITYHATGISRALPAVGDTAGRTHAAPFASLPYADRWRCRASLRPCA